MKLSFSLHSWLAVAYGSVFANAAEWTRLADLPTTTEMRLSGRGISSMAGGVINGQLLLVAGQEGTSGGDVFDTKLTRIFSPLNNTWTLGKDAPDVRERTASVVIENTFYVIGGAKAGEELISYANNWAYTPSTDSWRELASLPNTYYDAAGCSLNKTIYLFGGYSTGDDTPTPYNTTLIYSSSSDTWSQGSPLPLAVGEATCVAFGTDIYLFGGKYYDVDYQYSDEIQIYDTTKNTWSKGDHLPSNLKQFSATVVGDKVFFVPSEDTQPHAYDLTNKKWLQNLPQLPGSPRISPRLLGLQNKVYVVGGQVDVYTEEEYTYLYLNETLTLDLS
ncbi:galactose oxidase [Basidiobolus meristosporus CBS 931.73]|uniref:Galactose oxidase n=1 Tax=Basidiobolus meristosporus CBS 931.73 TaxID=1314790 RepID=A0A1Y1ZBK0_9FUNG|nr:galactose oxidase [Basidiobolus meristosporus CBS 931.73]|eukprot:ORY07630.1 galactose oxidase [Basidiobolus meristosporus CBS 931.73]